MRLETILREIEMKTNGFSDACVIRTRSKEAINILKNELPTLIDQELIKRYESAISELEKTEQLLNHYSNSLNDRMENGCGFRFADLANTAYNAIETIVEKRI